MKQILMTSPVNFNVQYEINPWMNGNLGAVDVKRAAQQWSELRNALAAAGADIIVLPKSPEYCPDAVFTANAGLIYGNHFLPSRFKHEERAIEEPFFINWFTQQKFDVDSRIPNTGRNRCSFEGAGDGLFNRNRSILWYGMGFRSSFEFKALLDQFFEGTDVIVRPLELVNPSFYHLDTCFCPLDTGELLWYPEAFSEYSQMVIDSWYEDKQIRVHAEDAQLFACSSVSIGKSLVTPRITPFLRNSLKTRGYEVTECDMSEFMKSGGAAKCLTLEVVK
jgi:N-dimethylarginine dimethylaminohydrolase